MGRTLNQLSALKEKDNKVYPTWDAVVERLGTKNNNHLLLVHEAVAWQWLGYCSPSVLPDGSD